MVLIIENDTHFARIMLDMARDKGFKGIVALDGETGLRIAHAYTPDAVTLDIDLPGVDGWTVLDRLKHHPDTRHVPVHIISGVRERQAGLKAGDVVTGINGQKVDGPADLARVVGLARPGQDARLTVWRDQSEKTLRIKIGELDEGPVVATRGTPGDADRGKLGLAVRPLTGPEQERLNTTGRIVVEDADGPAAIAGVERGDVILAVNGREVGTLSEFSKAVDAAGGTVALLIQRANAQIFVPIRIDS